MCVRTRHPHSVLLFSFPRTSGPPVGRGFPEVFVAREVGVEGPHYLSTIKENAHDT
jgi:hypothetical protein